MTSHTKHPDSHTHGLADDCPRCTEHAEHPFESLDDGNLRELIGRTELWMRDAGGIVPRSINELKAMRIVETALNQQRILRRLEGWIAT